MRYNNEKKNVWWWTANGCIECGFQNICFNVNHEFWLCKAVSLIIEKWKIATPNI